MLLSDQTDTACVIMISEKEKTYRKNKGVVIFMSVTVCIAGLGLVILTSWYSFMQELADRAERKRRIESLAAGLPESSSDTTIVA